MNTYKVLKDYVTTEEDIETKHVVGETVELTEKDAEEYVKNGDLELVVE